MKTNAWERCEDWVEKNAENMKQSSDESLVSVTLIPTKRSHNNVSVMFS